MKKHIAYIISAAVILFSVVSCDKLPENGKLDGMWQIMSINYAHGSEYDSLVDINSRKSVQAHSAMKYKPTLYYPVSSTKVHR